MTANPSENPDQVVRDLLQLGDTLDMPGILFPTSDAFVLLISRYRDDLCRCFRFALPPSEVLEGILNKRRQYEAAERCGVPIATTFYPSTQSDVEEIQDRIEYPAFIKPLYSHLWQTKFPNKGFLVHNPTELMSTYRAVLKARVEAMVQSIIQGANTNHVKVCGYFDENSHPLALFVTQKIRQYPTDFGVGTLMQSIHNEEVLEFGLRFFRGIGYRGVGSIEFKKDDRDGRYKMIELNARLWQQNIQATVAGVNFPLIQYLHLTGQPVPAVTDFRDGVRWFDAIQDFQAFWTYRKQGKLSVGEWLRSWIGSECFAYFAWDDLKPGWRNSQYGLKYLRLPLHILKNSLR
jgi:predicted ATP-grasp superfamily ATP-dependent carboligase